VRFYFQWVRGGNRKEPTGLYTRGCAVVAGSCKSVSSGQSITREGLPGERDKITVVGGEKGGKWGREAMWEELQGL